MTFKIEAELNITEKELREYARKYLGFDFAEYHTWDEVVEHYLENYWSENGRYFRNVKSSKVFKI